MWSLPDLKIELAQFPFGAHDDMVDALGLAGQLLDKVWRASKPIVEIETPSFADYTIKTPEELGIPSFKTM